MEDFSDLRVMPNTAIFGNGLKVKRIIGKLKSHFLENGSSIISLSVSVVNTDDNLYSSNPIKRIMFQLKECKETNVNNVIFIKIEHEKNDESIQEAMSDLCKLLDNSEAFKAKVIVNFRKNFELDEELSKRFELICFGIEQDE